MSTGSARLSLGFSCVGHSFSHLFQPIFYLTVLTLEKDLGLSHGEIVALIVAGNVLYGVAAPAAGWLGDRWSATGMMVLFFVGTGAGMVMTGLAGSPLHIALWLAATGLFASIYHPVGIAWLVRNAESRGMALGVNGVFGGLGPAAATLAAGALIEHASWRAAFIVPGAIIIATGLLFLALLARGLIVETKIDRKQDALRSRDDMVRAFLVLAVTMLATGLIYQAIQPAMPKMISERAAELTGGGVFGVSLVIAVVYLVAGAMQVVGGHLADRYPLKTVYLVAFALQIPILLLVGSLSGTALAVAVVVMISVNVGGMPAESMLVASYAPSRWRSLAFGLKFILALGVGSLGVVLEGVVYDATGGFYWLFVVLAAVAAVALAAGMLLPADGREPVPAAAE
jgi:MFS family permease